MRHRQDRTTARTARKLSPLCSAFLLLALAGPAAAARFGYDGPGGLHATNGNKVVKDASGELHLVYTDEHAGSTRILYRKAAGVDVGAPELVSGGIAACGQPTIALDDLGRLGVAFVGDMLFNPTIYYTYRTGAGWAPPLMIDTGITPSTVGLEGDVHLAWNWSFSEIRYHSFDTWGPFAGSETVADAVTCNTDSVYLPSIAVAAPPASPSPGPGTGTTASAGPVEPIVKVGFFRRIDKSIALCFPPLDELILATEVATRPATASFEWPSVTVSSIDANPTIVVDLVGVSLSLTANPDREFFLAWSDGYQFLPHGSLATPRLAVAHHDPVTNDPVKGGWKGPYVAGLPQVAAHVDVIAKRSNSGGTNTNMRIAWSETDGFLGAPLYSSVRFVNGHWSGQLPAPQLKSPKPAGASGREPQALFYTAPPACRVPVVFDNSAGFGSKPNSVELHTRGNCPLTPNDGDIGDIILTCPTCP